MSLRVRTFVDVHSAGVRPCSGGSPDAMTIATGHEPDPSHSFTLARQRKLKRTLETYGVLTRESLCEAAHATTWHTPFEVALRRAIRAGRVRRLADDLFEAGPTP
jgi:hypothetical protein